MRTGSPSWCSNSPQRPLWTCGERIRWALHRSTEGVTGYATLPAQALQPSSCSESPQDCADSAVCETCTCRYAPQPARTQQPRGRSRSARRHPPPTRQGPWLKIALDPERPASSWSAGQEEERVESRHGRDRPPKGLSWETSWHPVLSGAEGIVSVATGPYKRPLQLSAVIAEKIKPNILKKRAIFLFRPSRVPCLRCSRPLEFIQPLATRAEAWQAIPECQSGLWG